MRYCEQPFLSIDNCLSEQTLRCGAIGRKNWILVGNDRGGHTVAVLFSFTASCKANQVETWTDLRDIVLRLASATPSLAEELDDLLPDAWLVKHPEARRCWSRSQG